MLKQRIITALLLLAIILFCLFSERAVYWEALINIVIVIAFWEWLRFCSIKSTWMQTLLIVGFALVLYCLKTSSFSLQPLLVAICLLWFILFGFTFTERFNLLHNPIVKLLIGKVLLSIVCVTVVRMQQIENGGLWIMCMFVSVWAADIGAYFVGKRYGKTKLAPMISPGKTVEGLFGGIGFAMLIYVPVLLLNFELTTAAVLLVIVLVTVLVSVIGDLFESKLKRYVALKDSSQILPGHGGILDRIDSLLCGAPFFALGLCLLGYLN